MHREIEKYLATVEGLYRHEVWDENVVHYYIPHPRGLKLICSEYLKDHPQLPSTVWIVMDGESYSEEDFLKVLKMKAFW